MDPCTDSTDTRAAKRLYCLYMATARVNLRIPQDLWRTAQQKAANDHTTTTAVVTAALTAYLNEPPAQPGKPQPRAHTTTPAAKTRTQPAIQPCTTPNGEHPPINRIGAMCTHCGKPWR